MAFTTNRICRTCMAESSALMPIWPTTKSTPVDPSSSITMMLKSFTTIDAFDGDGLPEHVCITCISELNRAYSFKQKCERSEYTLRMYLQVPMEEEQTKRKDTVESIEPQVTVTVPECPKEQKIQIMVLSRPSLLTSQSATSFVYQCSSCAATFLSLDTLKQHIITVHNAVQCDQSNRCDETEVDPMSTQPNADATIVNQRKFACEICSLEFVKKDIFDDHCSKIHMQEPFEMLNDDAADSFEEITYEHYEETEELNETEEMPTQLKTEINPADEALPPNKDTKFYCSRCNASFAKQLSLNIHFNSKKCMQESYECDICNRVFARKKYLLMHMKLHSNRSSTRVVVIDNDKKINKDRVKLARSEEKRFECSDCPKSFRTPSTLKDHLRTHSGERPYLCSICGKGFTQNANLKQHLMRHNKTKPFKCKDCSHAFVSKGELDTHERKHTGEHPFICDDCGSGFTTSSSMVKHKRMHTGERPYACEHCPMRFSALATLKNHRRTHTGERPFKCTQCDRSFTQKSDCVIHMRTHSGERPYTCTECNQTFAHGSSWKTHLRLHQKMAKVVVQPEVSTIEDDESLIEILSV